MLTHRNTLKVAKPPLPLQAFLRRLVNIYLIALHGNAKNPVPPFTNLLCIHMGEKTIPYAEAMSSTHESPYHLHE